MRAKKGTIPITVETPKRKKEDWYIFIYSRDNGERLRELLKKNLINTPFIRGSDYLIWLEKVDFLIIPRDAKDGVESALENTLRHRPIKIDIGSIHEALIKGMVSNFYENYQIEGEENKLVDLINELKQQIRETEIRQEARMLRDRIKKVIKVCEEIKSRDIGHMTNLSEKIEKDISPLREFLKRPLPVL